SVTAGAAIAPAVQVTVRDQFGNQVTSATNLITLTMLQSGRGTPANNTQTPSGGIATFTNLSTTKATTAGAGQTVLLTPDSLIATAPGVATSDTSTAFAVNPAAASTSLSTVGAAPGTITASSGSSTSTVTVTAQDAFSNIIQGSAVALSYTGTGQTFSPASGSTNSSGQFVSSFSSTKAESQTINATVGGNALSSGAPITVTAAAVSGTQSTITPSPSSITACAASCSPGAGTASQITIAAKDAFGNAVPNAIVIISVSGLGNTLTPSGTTQTAGSNGIATWQLSSTVPEAKTVSASANGVSITPSATVTVGTTGVSASQSTVTASLSSITACQTSCSSGAGTQTVITVSAKDQFGNGVGGANVTIAISGTGGNSTTPASLTQTANGSGVATWTLNSTIAESKTVTANAGGVAITDNAPVTITPGPVSASQSTVTTPQTTDSACTGTCTTAAGRASLITITAKDQFSNLIQNASVVMSSTGTSNNFTAPPNTNSSGVSTSTFSSTKAEGKTISATVGGVLVTGPGVTVIPAGVNASHSSLTRGLATITACQTSCTTGGGTGSLITVTAKDVFDNVIQNAKVVLSSTGSNPAFTPAPPNTNGSGVSTSTFSSTTAEGKTISGTLQVGSGTIVGISGTAGVTVGADVADHLTFTTGPSTTNANATINPAIVVTAFDQFGNVATGYSGTITLSITAGTPAAGGPGGLSGTNPVTATNGVATFSGMSMTDTGTGYSLDASDGSLTTTSGLFDIN
ncbi:MAG TPA: Ig-like domain-containing protein, partial [Gemmatimonadales bacterium]|nr:Ig-like domain-containing protein [Gemmatimonadales bacterium]